MRKFVSILLLSACLTMTASNVSISAQEKSAPEGAASETSGIKWEGWSDSVFERAKRENKFVLLDLEAIWCHWCHVMDKQTYSDPAVIALINKRYIAVRVDQDSRPD